MILQMQLKINFPNRKVDFYCIRPDRSVYLGRQTGTMLSYSLMTLSAVVISGILLVEIP